MEKREFNIEDKKETEPPKKRKRKPIPKKQMIYTTKEKQESDKPTYANHKFNSMNDYI